MIKDRIKSLRKNNHLTQTELAAKISVTQQAIGGWESGSREPDFLTLCKLADLFGVTTDYLLGRDVSPAPASPLQDSLSPDDRSLLTAYHTAPQPIQTAVDGLLAPYRTQNPAASENAAG